MRVRAQQFASKRQPQHAHEHTGQGLRDPSRLRYARPTEKHFESNRAPPRGSNDATPNAKCECGHEAARSKRRQHAHGRDS
eukprot:scaffold63015_cov82-Phaeocystis_antarctica.AAC.3